MLTLLERLESRLSKAFNRVDLGNNMVYFQLQNGEIAHLVEFVAWKCIVVEYAESKESMLKFGGDGDGYQHYYEEMTEDELFDAICQEMENEGKDDGPG